MTPRPHWMAQYGEERAQKTDMGEIEWRALFIEQVIKRGFGWPSARVRNERDRTDVRLFDEQGFSYAVIETKISDKALDTKKAIAQARGYLTGSEAVFCLASPERILVFLPDGRPLGELAITEGCETQARSLGLHHDGLAEQRHLVAFREGKAPYGFIPVDKRHPDNFPKFVEALRLCASHLRAFAERAWKQNQEQYAEYQVKRKDLEARRGRLEANRSGISSPEYDDQRKRLVTEEFELERKHRGPREIFERFWPRFHEVQPYSRDVGGDEKELLRIYLTDVSYIALCRILFVRICEDKALIKPKISNGGLEVWARLATQMERSYPDLLNLAYSETGREVYAPLFETGMFDWYRWQNGLLSATLERVFHMLNSFNLVGVDRDTLGDLYQEFLPKEQRKKLGEFYTPLEVVDYILKHAGWPVEGRLLDPACGSGTFLVRAAAARLRQMERRGISAAERLRALQDIIGLDVNPFAVYIAQMNLLFLVLDDYLEARKENLQYRLERLPVYSTDSLLGVSAKYLKEGLFAGGEPDLSVSLGAAARDDLGNYRRVVMNPPYIRNERLPEFVRSIYRNEFSEVAKGNADIFSYFMRKATDWLADGERLGVIVSLGLADADATGALRKFLGEFTVERVVPLEWAEVFVANINPILIFIRKARPRPDHEIVFVPGMRAIKDLAGSHQAEHRVAQMEWLNLAPDGSWRVEIVPADVPVLKKMRQAWEVASRNGNGGRRVRPLSAEYGLALRTTGGERQLIGERAPLENPHPVLDGREVKAWSVEWQGRYLDYQPDLISDPKTEEFFRPPFVVLPCISLTTQAVVMEAPPGAGDKPFMFRNTVMKCVGNHARLTPHVLAAIINSLPVRYYAFLMLRSGVVQKGFSHFYANTIEAFPVPDRVLSDAQFAARLERLSKKAHQTGVELLGWDRNTQAELAARAGQLRPFAQTDGADLRGYVVPLPIEGATLGGGWLQGVNLTRIGGAPEALEYLVLHAELDGQEELNREALERFPVPATQEGLRRSLEILRRWATGKPKAVEALKGAEKEIDHAALEGFTSLSAADRKHITRRAQEYPLAVVLTSPVPGSAVHRIGVKRWRSGERYRA